MQATLPRGEAYEFLVLGRQLERADVAARILAVGVARSLAAPATGSLEEIAQLTGLLKSCGASRPSARQSGAAENADRVLEYILLERSSPRTVLFCLEALPSRSLASIAGALDRPQRAVGRLTAELSFLEPSELSTTRLGPALERVAGRDRDQPTARLRPPTSRPASSSRAPSPRRSSEAQQ